MCGWPLFTSGAPAHQKFPSNQKFPFMDIPNTLPFMPHLPLVQQVTVSAFQNNTKHEKIGRTEIYHIWAQNITHMGTEYTIYGHRIYHIWAYPWNHPCTVLIRMAKGITWPAMRQAVCTSPTWLPWIWETERERVMEKTVLRDTN